MALSPNYGWAEPDNSSLVKNGAQDIRALGDAIDTSVWNIGYGQAGKNKIINGDFGIWQRGTSFASPSTASYTADRFQVNFNGTAATRTLSQQTFTSGTAPVSGYESAFFFRYNTSVAGSGGSFNVVKQKIEDVRTIIPNTTFVLSFWAKAAATTTIGLELVQDFGSGGSSAVVVTPTTSSFSVTTSWVRYSTTISVPSISGKTVGTSSNFDVGFSFPVNATFTVDLWGVQLEYGSKATPFETASGSIQGELALCQRYYYRNSASAYQYFATGANSQTTITLGSVFFPVTMRTAPSFAASAGNTFMAYQGTSIIAGTSISSDGMQPNVGGVGLTVASGLTVGNAVAIRANNTAAFLEFSAEL